jgi:hypothetical protein
LQDLHAISEINGIPMGLLAVFPKRLISLSLRCGLYSTWNGQPTTSLTIRRLPDLRLLDIDGSLLARVGTKCTKRAAVDGCASKQIRNLAYQGTVCRRFESVVVLVPSFCKGEVYRAKGDCRLLE